MNGDKPQTPQGSDATLKPDASSPVVAPQIAEPPTPVAPNSPQPSQEPAASPPPAEVPEQPVVLPATPVDQSVASDVDPDLDPATQMFDNPEENYNFATAGDEPEVADVTWTASEFIAHEKSAMWYVILAGITIVVIAAIYFLLHDFVAIAAFTFVAILFGFLAAHKPRVLTYSVTPAGLTIESKTYAFTDFKSYGVVNEGVFSSITFLPMKRFMPTLSIYYPPEQEGTIVQALSNYLPFAPVTHDLVDRLMHRIRL